MAGGNRYALAVEAPGLSARPLSSARVTRTYEVDRNERVKRSISSRLLLRLMIARSASFLANTPICSGSRHCEA